NITSTASPGVMWISENTMIDTPKRTRTVCQSRRTMKASMLLPRIGPRPGQEPGRGGAASGSARAQCHVSDVEPADRRGLPALHLGRHSVDLLGVEQRDPRRVVHDDLHCSGVEPLAFGLVHRGASVTNELVQLVIGVA